MSKPYATVHLSEIPPLVYEEDPWEAEWLPVRIHFGITAFGTNAYRVAEAGQTIIVEHSETDESGTSHQELYVVLTGRARFTIAGEDVSAGAGTLVYVPDPGVTRSAVAEEPGTTVLCFGGTPGEPFSVSPWEAKYDPATA